MKRNATAVWNGTIKEGKGTLSTQSGTLQETQYSFNSRFESGSGTNPEELIAAAHAGCFAMQLSAFLTEENFNPEKLEASCEITIEDFKITNSHLKLQATIPDIDNEKFNSLVTKAEENCPVSKLLNAKITSEATLNN